MARMVTRVGWGGWGGGGCVFFFQAEDGIRDRLVTGVQTCALPIFAGEIDPESIDCEAFAKRLYTAEIPDPDLLIRTSGEFRLSNFLLWQCSYAEIVITRKYWPDFKKADLHEAVEEYARRHRRFGAI